MANLGTLRYHPWPVKRADTDMVDQLRIDLDPQPGTDFRDAARAAHELREVLADAGLIGFPKTSGGRGVHVFVPVEPAYGFIEARHAVIALGRELARRMPDHVTDQLVEGGARRRASSSTSTRWRGIGRSPRRTRSGRRRRRVCRHR